MSQLCNAGYAFYNTFSPSRIIPQGPREPVVGRPAAGFRADWTDSPIARPDRRDGVGQRLQSPSAAHPPYVQVAPAGLAVVHRTDAASSPNRRRGRARWSRDDRYAPRRTRTSSVPTSSGRRRAGPRTAATWRSRPASARRTRRPERGRTRSRPDAGVLQRGAEIGQVRLGHRRQDAQQDEPAKAVGLGLGDRRQGRERPRLVRPVKPRRDGRDDHQHRPRLGERHADEQGGDVAVPPMAALDDQAPAIEPVQPDARSNSPAGQRAPSSGAGRSSPADHATNFATARLNCVPVPIPTCSGGALWIVK